MSSKVATKRKTVAGSTKAGKARQIAAGEFKAKCLGVIREVADTGNPMMVTLRGKPLVEVIPSSNRKKTKAKDDFIGRLEGVIKINGDPDDLIKPVFPLEDWDMLR
jgi:prevent-host-death family protein